MDISFIVIGYNEAAFLPECFSSVRHANLKDISYELIYVDGGSEDDSQNIAESIGVDKLLGGEKRRRAAENRNLGLMAAEGKFVQFIDGDMVMASDWPMAAIEFLKEHKNVAAACGILEEVNPSAFYKALQIDWNLVTGEVAYCGGAAMWRRNILLQVNGFPESVAYGEEPYLCWQVRNELGYKIFFLEKLMAHHDLSYAGLGDYLKRNIRCGESYAEIASLCASTKDRLWFKETISNLLWTSFFAVAFLIVIIGPLLVKAAAVIFLCLLLFRKMIQFVKRGNSFAISICYALHVYGSKLPLAWGECRWFFRFIKKKLGSVLKRGANEV